MSPQSTVHSPQSSFSVKLTIEVPTGPKNSIDGTLMERVITMPFIPGKGTMIAAPGDDYRKVDEVYWSEKDGFEIFLEFSKFAKVKTLNACGWRIVK